MHAIYRSVPQQVSITTQGTLLSALGAALAHASEAALLVHAQVLCNGLVPTGVAVAYGLVAGCVDVPLGPSAQLEVWRAKVLTLLAGAYLGW